MVWPAAALAAGAELSVGSLIALQTEVFEAPAGGRLQ